MYEDIIKFVKLIDNHSFTLAANELHISQPALSVAIKNLEKQLQVNLIIRSHRSFKISPMGQLVYDHAVAIKNNVEQLKLDLINATNQKINLKIGLIDSVAETLFIESNDFFNLISDLSNLNISINNSDILLNQFNRSELDIVCLTKSDYSLKFNKFIGNVKEPFCLVTSSQNYELADAEIKKNQKISNFLSYNSGSNTSKIIDKFFIENNISINKTFFSTSPNLALQLTLKGNGTVFLPKFMVNDYVKSGVLKQININGFETIYRSVDILSINNTQVIKIAKLIYQELKRKFSLEN